VLTVSGIAPGDRRGYLLPNLPEMLVAHFGIPLAHVVLLALITAAVAIPALTAVALVSAVCSLVVAYETIRHRADRIRVRHPELAT
jgi:fatty-acyl-CoA synthase